MKTFIIAAQSADGFIAKDQKHPAYWTSREDKKRFVELTKRAGVVIMGRATFETLHKPLSDRRVIVYSRSPLTLDNAEVTNLAPQVLLQKLEAEGVQEVAICGGSEIYTLFLQSQLVSKIYLTIEPILFGTGIAMFNTIMNVHLKLVNIEKTDGGSVLLEYDVHHHTT